jgi:hypothetical protein
VNWTEAVECMRAGARVRLKSEMWRKVIDAGDDMNPGIVECGMEGCILAHAWTDDEKPVLVFRGADSGQLFVPEDEHRTATDWVIEPPWQPEPKGTE